MNEIFKEDQRKKKTNEEERYVKKNSEVHIKKNKILLLTHYCI